MRITVFGASGKVDRLVVWEILRRGHQVHAFVHSRNPFEAQEEVTVVKAEVADTVAVHAALADSDAVISTLGGWGKTSSDVLATGMTTIIPAMQALHLTRIVTLTGAGARWAGDRSSLRLAVNRAALTMMKSPALRDAEKHLDILARSSLDWTSVRAPGISAEGPDGYRLDTKLPSLLTKIPGPAVAKSLIDLAEQPEFHRQAPGIHRA